MTTTRTIGPFQLGRQIGIGGMGIVYSAIYPSTGKTVAVKVLSPGLIADPKLVKRFAREMEILKRLNHPNIVKYYGGGIENNQHYYAMEFIDGGSLQDTLKKRTRLTWDQAIHVGRQVSSALEHAHNAGIIHRDLKPANLFLTKKGRLKLGDFGIARDTEATALTAAGKTVGTYAYMAPEQIQAGPAISRKTDLYALGCVLYEVLIGETPFKSDNPMEMLMQHLQDDPYSVCEKVPECPIALDKLIEELLAKNPDDRPYDALAVHTRLGEIREMMATGGGVSLADTVVADSVSTKEEKKADTAAKKKKKKKKKKQDVPIHERGWFLTLCLIALIAATAWFLQPHSEDWYADQWRDLMPGDKFDQQEALRDYIDPYLEKFPEGKDKDEARLHSDDVHCKILEVQLRNMAKLPLPVDSAFKKECVDALKLENEEGLFYSISWDKAKTATLAANPLPTMERWKALIQKWGAKPPPDDETRWLLLVCERHHSHFREELIASPNAEEYFHERMLAAEEKHATSLESREAEALAIWWHVYQEFAKVDRFSDFSEYARKRHNREEVPIPPAVRPAPGNAVPADKLPVAVPQGGTGP